MQVRGQIGVDDVFTGCKVIEQNHLYFFLVEPGRNAYYDIVMPKEHAKDVKIGQVLDVVVLGINFAKDGTPGVFVRPK